ncbi:MAG: type II secretion system F family protein [Vulcanimicrobiaceae bacterium]
MTQFLPLGIALFAALSMFLIVFSMLPRTNLLKSRIRKLESVDEQSVSQRKLIIDQIVSTERRSALQSKLNEAGWYEVTPGTFALRGIGALGIGLCLGLLLIVFLHNVTMGAIIGVLIALVGWRTPSFMLSRAIKTRKEAVARDLPEFLDLLSTTVQAGLALNAALIQSTEVTKGPLHEELTATLSEIRLGRSRRDALDALADRLNENSLTMTVSSIVQAERLGSDLADVLRELARESRDRRWTRAEEKAAQLPVKMIIPMALFMIPSLYLMIFGPVIAEFVEHR